MPKTAACNKGVVVYDTANCIVVYAYFYHLGINKTHNVHITRPVESLVLQRWFGCWPGFKRCFHVNGLVNVVMT